MEYLSPRSTGQFNRRSAVVSMKGKRRERKTSSGKNLLSIAAVAAAIGASVPLTVGNFQLTEQGNSSTPETKVVQRQGIVICQGGDRKDRKVTCLVDGDTGWENGIKWRLHNIDTPELNSPACSNERQKAIQARDRLQQLMNAGYELMWTGSSGSYGRKIVRIKLADGRFAGDVLLAEGLAQPWPNNGNVWCGN